MQYWPCLPILSKNTFCLIISNTTNKYIKLKKAHRKHSIHRVNTQAMFSFATTERTICNKAFPLICIHWCWNSYLAAAGSFCWLLPPWGASTFSGFVDSSASLPLGTGVRSPSFIDSSLLKGAGGGGWALAWGSSLPVGWAVPGNSSRCLRYWFSDRRRRTSLFRLVMSFSLGSCRGINVK